MASNFDQPITDGDYLPELENFYNYIFSRIVPDKYDSYGRNISEQERRQKKVPWIRVRYGKKRFISTCNKNSRLIKAK